MDDALMDSYHTRFQEKRKVVRANNIINNGNIRHIMYDCTAKCTLPW